MGAQDHFRGSPRVFLLSMYSAGLGLPDNFRELTSRRSEWEGEGFVIGLGRVEYWLESL